MFRYTKAIVRGVSPLVQQGLRLRDDGGGLLGLGAGVGREAVLGAFFVADAYVSVLRDILDEIVVLEPAEECPDSCFVEDIAVVEGDVAFVTIPGASSRHGEIDGIRSALQGLGLHLIDMKGKGGGTLDGGDVLWTGNAFFVGKTLRTNETGIAEFANAMSPRPVHVVDMQAIAEDAGAEAVEEASHTLHLKSLCSILSSNTLLAVDSALGRGVAKFITSRQPSLSSAFLPDAPAANVVLVNDHVLIREETEFPSSIPTLVQTHLPSTMTAVQLSGRELGKIDGALTCCSILIP